MPRVKRQGDWMPWVKRQRLLPLAMRLQFLQIGFPRPGDGHIGPGNDDDVPADFRGCDF